LLRGESVPPVTATFAIDPYVKTAIDRQPKTE
jgi:hypothetical protein